MTTAPKTSPAGDASARPSRPQPGLQPLGLPRSQKPVGSLGGLTLLYVGGRPHLIAQARLAIRNRGAVLLTHDGGSEDAVTVLPGLVARADAVLCPVAHVSHDAAAVVERCCIEFGRDFLRLPAADLGSLVVALRSLGSKAAL
ncbi:DUF2325 domain-containing protein [Enterovirga rhinocerotis]|uniref:Uncharacterized protein DUF2325 n=1 Tax=Enterovirga rhinocerotis TaxID=1339210 RepID=A0A4R7BN82_9HYPH|nr:DUF2325 domain-containing protein [Enterovirga rhinocerotis]TDR85387.1 uncharacterized protein DUF2325 [Enterovirga rhinocerotis]